MLNLDNFELSSPTELAKSLQPNWNDVPLKFFAETAQTVQNTLLPGIDIVDPFSEPPAASSDSSNFGADGPSALRGLPEFPLPTPTMPPVLGNFYQVTRNFDGLSRGNEGTTCGDEFQPADEIADVMQKYFHEIDGSASGKLAKFFGFDKDGHIDAKEILTFILKNDKRLTEREIEVMFLAASKQQELSNANNDEWGAENNGISWLDLEATRELDSYLKRHTHAGK